MFNKIFSTSLLSLVFCCLEPVLSFSEPEKKETKEEKKEATKTAPSLYAVYQQEGPTCPFIAWVNLEKIRAMRQRGKGRIQFQDQDFTTKIQSYALVLPQIRSLDRIYDDLRANCDSAYYGYEQLLRAEGIKDTERFAEDGTPIDQMDESPLDRARRVHNSPYNFKKESIDSGPRRRLPILTKKNDNTLYYYSYKTRKATPLPMIPESERNEKTDHPLDVWGDEEAPLVWTFRFSDEILTEMGIRREELNRVIHTTDYPGAKNTYFISAASNHNFNKEYFYEAGTFQHMLFACGLKEDNSSYGAKDDSLAAQACRDLQHALRSDPLNPWSKLNKEDLFEYHLAEIFRANPDLKKMAQATVNFFNNPYGFYRESLELFDSQKKTRKKLSEKQRFMPGEDQLLAYYFSSQLRFLAAASIGIEAIIAISELEDELDAEIIQALKAGDNSGGLPTLKDIIAASQKPYTHNEEELSFLDTWARIKAIFDKAVLYTLQKVDFVSFSGHGYVMSFDEDLLKQQTHTHKQLATALGFVMWDSTYGKGLKPFYRRLGKSSDKVQLRED